MKKSRLYFAINLLMIAFLLLGCNDAVSEDDMFIEEVFDAYA